MNKGQRAFQRWRDRITAGREIMLQRTLELDARDGTDISLYIAYDAGYREGKKAAKKRTGKR